MPVKPAVIAFAIGLAAAVAGPDIALGQTLSSFTSHRSPLGLAFDTAGGMGGPFNGAGFVLGFVKGDPTGESVPGPFNDASQDLLHLVLSKAADGTYRMQTTRLVVGFSNPIDTEIVGNSLYVLEYGGRGGLWEVTVPRAARRRG